MKPQSSLNPIVISIATLMGLISTGVALAQYPPSSHTLSFDPMIVVDDPTAAEGKDGEANVPRYTPSQERELSRQAEMTTRRWAAAPSLYGRERAEAELGRSRIRELDVARFELHRYEDHNLLARDLADDPEILDEVASDVLSSFLKLRREVLEDALGVDHWFSERRSRRAVGDDTFATSYRMRLSPQVDVGSRNSVGLKVKMPYTRNQFFDHLSLKLRQDVDTGEMRYSFKFDDGDRFFFLDVQPDSIDDGDRYELGVRMWF